MQNNNLNNPSSLFDLVSRYEDLTRKGAIPYLDESVYNRLIDYYQHEFLFEKALQVTELASEHYPCTVDFLLRQGQLYHCLGHVDKALGIIEQAAVLSPGQLEVQLFRAQLIAESGETQKALAIIEHLKNKTFQDEDFSMVLLHEAKVYEKMKQHERVFFILKQAIELDCKNEEALDKMSLCVEKTGKHMESIAIHKKVVDKEPYSAWGWYNLGNAYEYTCQYEKAIRAYEFVLVIDENFEYAYRNCADVCMNLHRYGQALKHYQEMLDRFEPDGDVFLNIGICNLKLNKVPAAKKYLLMAKEEDTFNEEVFFQLGKCYAIEGDWKKAVASYKKAISLDPLKEEFYIHLAKAYLALDNVAKAEKYFLKAADIGPDTFSNWQELIAFYLQFGEHEKAREKVKEAREYMEGSIEFEYVKVACLVLTGRRPEGLYILGELLDEAYKMHNVLFEVAPTLKDDEEVTDMIFSSTENQEVA